MGTAEDSLSEPRSDRELRNFGLLLGALFALVFAVVPWLRRGHVALWPWALAGILWAAALLRPRLLQAVYRGWTRLGLVLGRFNTRVILTLIFFLTVAPLGIVMRLLGRDRMGRRFEPGAQSYRVDSRERPKKSMERPF